MGSRRFSFTRLAQSILTVASLCVPLFANPSKQTLFDSVDKMINSEKYGEAISISKQIDQFSLSIDEKYRLNLKRGICYYSLWNISNAESSFNNALLISGSASQSDVKKEEVIFHLGELYYSSRNYPKALELLEHLMTQYNSKFYPDYLFYLGKTYIELKQTAKAKACFDTICSSFSAHPKAVLAQKLRATLPNQ